jgi:general nucleoside transport system permease protein
MNTSIVVVILASAVAYGTPLLYAALGELLAERSGVLNLGVEGMMLVGAVVGFLAVQRVSGPAGLVLPVAIGVAALTGAAAALILAFLVITLRANQIVSGLALTILAGAAGLSSYIGNDFDLSTDPARYSFAPVNAFGLQDMPIVGPIVFGQNWLVYASWLCVIAVSLYLSRTRPGLNVRAVGEAPAAADAMGISVTKYRYLHTLAGGAFAGVGGACYSLAITPQWQDGLTAGAGWIAIALVIFAFWRADLCLVGAYVFGAFSALPFTLQARGVTVAPELFQALPYLMTIVVLVVVSSGIAKRRLSAPASLGVPYVREER